MELLASCMNYIVHICHTASYTAGWWHDPETGEPYNVDQKTPEKLMLTVSEVSEAMEGHRKG